MKVLYTGAFRFPDKDAAGKRVFNIVNTLSEKIDFTVLGWEQVSLDSRVDCEKFQHVSTGDLDGKKSNVIHRVIGFLFQGFKSINILRSMDSRFDIVVIYNPPFIYSIYMYFWAKWNKVKIIIESTEWYESEHLVGGKYGLAALENFLRMRFSYPKFKYFIVMSKFMESYFSRFTNKDNIERLPPLSSFFNKKNELKESTDLRLLYAGSPGRKDKLNVIIAILLRAKTETYHLTVAGVTESDFYYFYPEFKEFKDDISESVTFLGRIPMERVYNLYEVNDYVIFARENKRYALAGFPSKFVEAVSFDTPVLTNNVGDIGQYIGLSGIAFDPDNCEPDALLQMAREKKYSFKSGLYLLYMEEFNANKKCDSLYNYFCQVVDDV